MKSDEAKTIKNDFSSGKETKPFAYGLKAEALTGLETLAQSLGAMAPTATPAILVPLVFASAGNGTWLTYIFATIAVALAALNIHQFTCRSASPGSLYSYAAIGLGPAFGILTGWSLLFAYIIVISTCVTEFTIYLNAVMKSFFSFEPAPIFSMLLCTILTGFICYKDIKLSAVVMLLLELLSMSLILFLVAITLYQHGWSLDRSQIALTNATPAGLSMGLVLAIGAYTGFESAASLGSESKSPLKTIPQAIIFTVLIGGMFFVISAYAMVLGFSGHSQDLGKCATPLFAIAQFDGVPFLGSIINVGAMISFFACVIACINTAARIFFLMGHHGVFHSSMNKVHDSNETPHIAVLVASVLGLIPALSLLCMRCPLLDIVGLTGTIAVYGFIIAYILVSLAAPVYVYKHHQLKLHHIVLAVLSIAAMLVALIGNVYPIPPAPYDMLPHLFLSYMAAGVMWYFILKTYKPNTIASMEADLIAIRERFEQQPQVPH